MTDELIRRATERLSEIPLDAITAAGLDRKQATYFLNISYPSLQAMDSLTGEEPLFLEDGAAKHLRPAAIYIHIPFCTALCHYCHYYKLYGSSAEVVDSYLESLAEEMRLLARHYGPIVAKSIYVGGGTPSFLTPAQIDKLFHIIDTCLSVEEAAEISFEMHPESVDLERLDRLQSHGVNRINLGVESLVDNVLSLENRRHSVGDVMRAIELVGPRFEVFQPRPYLRTP